MIHTSDLLKAKLLIVDDQAANVLLLERLLPLMATQTPPLMGTSNSPT